MPLTASSFVLLQASEETEMGGLVFENHHDHGEVMEGMGTGIRDDLVGRWVV